MLTLRNISKKFGTFEEFFFFYSSQIGHNPDKHKEIMEILDWAKQYGKITYGILEFVTSHKWEELKYLKDHPQEGQVESTFNVYETL